MKQNLLFTFSLFLLLNCSSSYAQDSTKFSINPGLQIYLDYGKLLTLPLDFEQKYEFGIAYQLKMGLQHNFQYGLATIKQESAIENGTYTSEGTYWRAGINYLIPINANSSLFLGAKYGQSKFDDKGTYKIESELWDTYSGSFSRTDFEADWFEVVMGSEKSILKGHVILGGQTGVRIINKKDKAEFIDIYSIPGYGLTSDKSTPFLNLYIKYQF